MWPLVRCPCHAPYWLDRKSMTGWRPACLDHMVLTFGRVSNCLPLFLAFRINSKANLRFFFQFKVLTVDNALPNLIGEKEWRWSSIQPWNCFLIIWWPTMFLWSTMISVCPTFDDQHWFKNSFETRHMYAANGPCGVGLAALEMCTAVNPALSSLVDIAHNHLLVLELLRHLVIHDLGDAPVTCMGIDAIPKEVWVGAWLQNAWQNTIHMLKWTSRNLNKELCPLALEHRTVTYEIRFFAQSLSEGGVGKGATIPLKTKMAAQGTKRHPYRNIEASKPRLLQPASFHRLLPQSHLFQVGSPWIWT